MAASLQFILGPTASGKTNRICKAALDAAIDAPRENFILIVPEQATLQMQKRITAMHPQGCVMNIDSVSFNRLAHKVFSELGIDDKNVLDDLGKTLVLRRVLGKMAEDGEESGGIPDAYKKKIHHTGFVSGIKSQLSEFAQYGIDDNELFVMEESVSKDAILKDKIHLIREVKKRFGEEIRERFKTSEELFDLFSKVIGKSSHIIGAHIYLDGFTGFTPIQFKLLREILRCAASVTVALTLPPEEIRENIEAYEDYDLFALPAREYFTLRKIAKEEGARISGDIVTSKGSGERCACISSGASPNRMFENLPPKISVISAADPEDESIKTASAIARLVQEEGYRYRDIAVVCSDLEGCFHHIRDIFSSAKIPCFIDYKPGLSANPLSRFILSAVGMCLSFTRQSEEFFAMLKTGITDICADEVCLLENYCLEFGMNSLSKMGKEFGKNRRLGGKKTEGVKDAWDLEKINEIREKAAAPALPFYDAMTRAADSFEYCRAIVQLLEDSGAETKMAKLSAKISDISLAGEYERVYALTTELLEKIGKLLSGDKISLREFFDILKVGLDSMKIGLIPPSLDTVTVGDVVRSRLDKPKVLFIMGANAGKLPKPAESGGIFTERERTLLKSKHFELAPTMLEDLYSQQFYIYLMLNKASDALFVSFSAQDGEGEAALPAYTAQELMDLTAQDFPLSAKGPYWEAEALKNLAKETGKYAGGGAAGEDLKELVKYFAENRPDRFYQILDGAVFTNLESPLDPAYAEKLYGGKLVCSASSIETYNKCAFMHFLSYGLKLKERPEYKPDLKSIGTIYHGALERYSKALEKAGLTFRSVSDAVSDSLTERSLDEELEKTGTDVFESTKRYAYIKENMRRVLKKTTRVLRSQIIKGSFEPAEFEHKFRMGVSDKIELSGIIDRIDIYDAGDVFVRVIDYKSGGKKFDVIDVYNGLSLQLPVYLEAALKEEERKGRHALPAGLYYYHVADGYAKKDEARTKYRMDGPTNNDEKVFFATDSSVADIGGASEVVNLKYEKGTYVRNQNTIGTERFENMLDFTHGKIAEAGEEILNGNVAINPYEKSDKPSCEYCGFADVCKFEQVTFDVDFRDLGDIERKAAEAAVYDGIKEDGD